jgi:hypothetical protein
MPRPNRLQWLIIWATVLTAGHLWLNLNLHDFWPGTSYGAWGLPAYVEPATRVYARPKAALTILVMGALSVWMVSSKGRKKIQNKCRVNQLGAEKDTVLTSIVGAVRSARGAITGKPQIWLRLSVAFGAVVLALVPFLTRTVTNQTARPPISNVLILSSPNPLGPSGGMRFVAFGNNADSVDSWPSSTGGSSSGAGSRGEYGTGGNCGLTS